MTSIGIVGFGTIGRAILNAVTTGYLPVGVAGVTSRSAEKAKAYLQTLPDPPPYLNLDGLIAKADLLIEAAGGSAVVDLAQRTFVAGKDLVVISGGALLDHPELFDLARQKNCRLIIPSGAIAGLDALKSACAGKIDSVTISSRKPPQSWAGSPYVAQHNLSLEGITEETEIYSGPVREACRGFPENVNVAAAVSMAGIGPDRTRIRILAVPGLDRNCHVIEVKGEFGEFTVEIRNIPTDNPKTGRLAAMSVIRSIRDAVDPVRVGT